MTTIFFYIWPLWGACSFSGCEWAYCHGTLLCEFSIPKCGGVLGGNDQNRVEKQNVVLTWFRPVTWSSGHLGRRKFWPERKDHIAYAGSGLPQGPFLENYLFVLQVGLRWVFVNGLKWVKKCVKSGFLGAKVGQNASKPTCPPT